MLSSSSCDYSCKNIKIFIAVIPWHLLLLWYSIIWMNCVLFRFLMLCIHNKYWTLKQLGLDTFGNLALKVSSVTRLTFAWAVGFAFNLPSTTPGEIHFLTNCVRKWNENSTPSKKKQQKKNKIERQRGNTKQELKFHFQKKNQRNKGLWCELNNASCLPVTDGAGSPGLPDDSAGSGSCDAMCQLSRQIRSRQRCVVLVTSLQLVPCSLNVKKTTRCCTDVAMDTNL